MSTLAYGVAIVTLITMAGMAVIAVTLAIRVTFELIDDIKCALQRNNIWSL